MPHIRINDWLWLMGRHTEPTHPPIEYGASISLSNGGIVYTQQTTLVLFLTEYGMGIDTRAIRAVVEFTQTHKPIGICLSCCTGTNLSPAFAALLLHLLDGVPIAEACATIVRCLPETRVHPEVKAILKGFLQGQELMLP